jgi:hypothetical protein
MPFAAAMLLLVVRTYDVAHVPARALDTAKHVSGRILQRAGIEVTWIACGQPSAPTRPDPCVNQPAADELLMRITAAEGHPGGGLAIDALGDSYVDTQARSGTLATLYADRIAAIASAAGVDVGTVLGLAMAHEIGHLLLGTHVHQPHGLMSERWSVSGLQRRFERDWEFSRTDVDQLGINLKRRQQTLTMSPTP